VFLGPIFVREVLTAPRTVRHYASRCVYTGCLFILLYTGWWTVVGFRPVESVADMARFAGPFFHLLAWVQIGMALFFAPILTASSITTEKDRRTFVLLLVTDLSSWEIVFGKLCASLLQIGVLLLSAFPVFVLASLLGGISLGQIVGIFVITAATATSAGTLGLLMATWREKTFQTLAFTVLLLALYLVLVEVSALGAPSWVGVSPEVWLGAFSPLHAVQMVLEPAAERVLVTAAAVQDGTSSWLRAFWPTSWRPDTLFVLWTLLASALMLAIASWKLRDWNPNPRERTVPPEEAEEQARSQPVAVRKVRDVWTNPVLWREIRTRAYGRRPAAIKAAYAVFVALLCAAFVASDLEPRTVDRLDLAKVLVPIVVVSLLLVNAQAVTSFTSERDLRSLDLLLVSDITPKEFIYGKIFGVLYNTKEMWLLPVVLCLYLWSAGYVGWEAWLYLVLGFVVMVVFSITVGLHAGITFERSRTAVGNSLGIIFFLFVGILVCVFLILVAGRFESQLASFLVFIVAGSIAMYASLGARNPSAALALTAALCPFLTWWCVVHLLPRGSSPGGDPLGGFLAIAIAYGFAVLAMLVPAVSEFDVALGRTVAEAEG
jgi:ABC-type Na+ efflux pump permease subunit